MTQPTATKAVLPSLRELGHDLQHINPWRRLFCLALPFFWCAAYFVFAFLDLWPLAVFALVALSFVTYGSNSHDLVHGNLGLSRPVNDILLSLMELLALRSGHAYQAAHLYHHAHYPDLDDIEATAARRSWLGAIGEGVVFQFRIYFWAMRHARPARVWIIGEGVACVTLIAAAGILSQVTWVFVVYVVLMVMGSWIIPLVTSYVPHAPEEKEALFQTRAFRGVVFSVLALEHLYHLEHHLYPSVPHQNWPRLAKRLDPFLLEAGVKPVTLWV